MDTPKIKRQKNNVQKLCKRCDTLPTMQKCEKICATCEEKQGFFPSSDLHILWLVSHSLFYSYLLPYSSFFMHFIFFSQMRHYYLYQKEGWRHLRKTRADYFLSLCFPTAINHDCSHIAVTVSLNTTSKFNEGADWIASQPTFNRFKLVVENGHLVHLNSKGVYILSALRDT